MRRAQIRENALRHENVAEIELRVANGGLQHKKVVEMELRVVNVELQHEKAKVFGLRVVNAGFAAKIARGIPISRRKSSPS